MAPFSAASAAELIRLVDPYYGLLEILPDGSAVRRVFADDDTRGSPSLMLLLGALLIAAAAALVVLLGHGRSIKAAPLAERLTERLTERLVRWLRALGEVTTELYAAISASARRVYERLRARVGAGQYETVRLRGRGRGGDDEEEELDLD